MVETFYICFNYYVIAQQLPRPYLCHSNEPLPNYCNSLDLLCVMLYWHCVCDADNGVAVSVNDIIIKLVATTLKVNTVHRLVIQHVNVLEQYILYTNHLIYIYTKHNALVPACVFMYVCVRESLHGCVCVCVYVLMEGLHVCTCVGRGGGLLEYGVLGIIIYRV